MADNERLLEAARMIQEHCNHTEQGGVCPFAHGGVCNGVEHCRLSIEGGLNPGIDWDLQNAGRWTDADIALAKALQAFGVKELRKREHLEGVIFDCDAIMKEFHTLPLGAFKDMKFGETVYISDIIAEKGKEE